jgi:hypothetical protein
MINTQYIRKLFKNDKLQIIIPKKRIQFNKLVNGVIPDNFSNRCNFDCFYYCWKMDVKRYNMLDNKKINFKRFYILVFYFLYRIYDIGVFYIVRLPLFYIYNFYI